jgi:hypothetical protein
MAMRLGNFVIFLLLTVITLGLYPFYFYVTRTQEQNDLLRRQVELLEMAIVGKSDNKAKTLI